MFDSEESQKKLCSVLRNVCFVSTALMAIYFIVAIWVRQTDNLVFMKVLFTYCVIMGSSLIIQRIFIDIKPKKND